MKLTHFITALTILFSYVSKAQNEAHSLQYQKGLNFLDKNQIDSAYTLFKNLTSELSEKDSLYKPCLWYYGNATFFLESQNRMDQNFEQSLEYGLEALDIINEGKEQFDEDYGKREYFMVKNITVSYFGLEDYKLAEKWKSKMYTAQKKGLLPDGLDEYFNFDFFKMDEKNVWGYEWFEELPKDRYSKSFSKIVYYVYSTNPDGSDKDQLYRLHVLMFHGDKMPFDYVMDKRLETATEEIGGTLYSYTYKEDIDYKKLKADVKQIINGNLEPDTKRSTSKEDGSSKVEIGISK